MNNKCLNCGSSISKSYCGTCGQSSSTGRLNLQQLVSNAVGHFFNMDSIVPKTLLDLSRKPGLVAKRYVDGQRVTYVAPFRYCLTAIALMMIYYSQGGNNAELAFLRSSPDLSPDEMKFQVEFVGFLMRHLNAVIFAALPLQALAIKWLFRKSRYNYSEVTSFSLYILGHTTLIGLFLALILYFNTPLQLIIYNIIQLGYGVWAAVGFFGENAWVTFFKILVANIINAIIAFIVIVILIIPKVVDMKDGFPKQQENNSQSFNSAIPFEVVTATA